MNKKLIAAAIAAVVAAPAAVAADTTIYGKLHVSIDSQDTAGTGDAWVVDSNASRIGFKGSEDLGDGLKAIFKVEVSYSMDTGGWGGGRNSYIGLSGGWGTVLAGRHDTPAKVGFYAAGNERLGDSILDLNSSFGFSELRASNAYAYISPNMSGFTVAVAGVPGEAPAGADGIADAYSIAVIYKGGGLKGSIGYTAADAPFGGLADDVDLLNIGGTYTFGDFSVGAQYQEVDGVGAGNTDTTWAITATAGFGNNKLIAIYGNSDDDSANQDYSTLGLAVQHIFSKRTSVYVAYVAADNPGNTRKADNWIGNGGTTPVGDAFSLGMIHTF